MNYILNAAQTKACDAAVIQNNLQKSLALINAAAVSCTDAIAELGFDPSVTLIFCGCGNNGADGAAIAGKLETKYDVTVIYADTERALSQEGAYYKEKLKKSKILHFSELTEAVNRKKYTLIIDALFGVGLSRNIEGKTTDMVAWINAAGTDILSVDMPTGISADNGQVLGCAVQASATVTFAFRKRGQLLYPGRLYCGKLLTADIGIPALEKESTSYCVAGLFDRENHLPKRAPDGNKGSFGKLLVAAGSREIYGAAYLCAMAAYKSGCGMVHILTEQNNRISLQQMLPEAILHIYDQDDMRQAQELLRGLLPACDVVLAGPGLGVNPVSAALVSEILDTKKPLVLDADALNIIAKEQLQDRLQGRPCILTPHVMEMSRLNGRPVSEIKADLIETANAFAARYQVTLALKDAVSVVASPQENTYINDTGNAAMAKAGSGDVLAGLIAALLAQKTDPYHAAALGVYLHGLAGDNKAASLGAYSLLARNLIEGIEELKG